MGRKRVFNTSFVIISFLILIPFISAVPPPQTNINLETGIQIQTSGIETIEQNINHSFGFHIFNITTQFALDPTTTNCSFHLYNKTGQHQFINNIMDFDKGDYKITLLGTNFSELGAYNYYIYCNNSAIGGFARENFEVTPTGEILETSESLLYIIILIVTFILFLGFLYPAIKLPYSNKTNKDGSITRISRAKYLKLLCVWFACGFFMWFLQALNGISSSFIKLTYLSNFITNIFTYSQGFSVGVTLLILTIVLIEVWKDIILSKTIKRFGKAFLDGRLQ